MAKSVALEAHEPFTIDDVADATNGDHTDYNVRTATDPDTVVYRLTGAFFFGAASTVGTILDRIADQRRNFILDLSAVPLLNSTAANVIEASARKSERAGVRFFITGASPSVRRMLSSHGVRQPQVAYAATVEDAQALLRSSAHGT